MNQVVTGKRMVSVDYALTATRLCHACGYDLPLTYFHGIESRTCLVCLAAQRAARPWTIAQMDALLRAARNVLDLWPRYFERWTEDDLVLFRALLEATDRLPLRDPDRENGRKASRGRAK